jgi:hypothetical protein
MRKSKNSQVAANIRRQSTFLTRSGAGRLRVATNAPCITVGCRRGPIPLTINQEQLALLSVEAGDTEAATTQFLAIAQDAETTRGLRERAFSMIVAMGGDIDALLGDSAASDAQDN